MNSTLLEVTKQIERAVLAQRRVAIVFDLDSTLFCVSSRTQAILRSLGSAPQFRSRFETAAERLRAVEIAPSEYSVRKIVARLNLDTSPELFESIRDYWRAHFFAGDHLHHDVLYPGAREYVEQLHGWGAQILYLTGRPSTRMREGTERILRASAFPAFNADDLLMKPDEADTDEHFKVVELRRRITQYDEVWFFENEPIILRDVCAMLPQIKVVFVDSVHAGKEEVPPNLLRIDPDYRSGIIL